MKHIMKLTTNLLLCLVRWNCVYGLITPLKIPPPINIAIVMELNDGKILWKKLKLMELGKEHHNDNIFNIKEKKIYYLLQKSINIILLLNANWNGQQVTMPIVVSPTSCNSKFLIAVTYLKQDAMDLLAKVTVFWDTSSARPKFQKWVLFPQSKTAKEAILQLRALCQMKPQHMMTSCKPRVFFLISLLDFDCYSHLDGQIEKQIKVLEGYLERSKILKGLCFNFLFLSSVEMSLKNCMTLRFTTFGLVPLPDQ